MIQKLLVEFQVINRRRQLLRAVLEEPKPLIAALAQRSSPFPRFVAMVKHLRRSATNGTWVLQRLQIFVIRNAVLSFHTIAQRLTGMARTAASLRIDVAAWDFPQIVFAGIGIPAVRTLDFPLSAHAPKP